MATVAGVPCLSQLLAWPTEHLTEAADHWEAAGGRSYEVANQVWRDALSVDWRGKSADALRAATHADMMTTCTVADQLQTAAKVARIGASDLYAARSRVRYAVEDAQTAGFDVGEEMSVIDRSTGGSVAQRAARQAMAEALAADIRQRAAQLVALDQQVAGKVTAAVTGIRDTFPQSPTPETPPTDSRVQAVDRQWKQDPTPPPDPGADPPWKNLPSPRTLEDVRDAFRQLRRGNNRPHRELDTPEEMREFYEWLTKGSVRAVPPFEFPRRMLPDGTVIEMRPDSGSGGPVIELKPPGAKQGPKIHLPVAPFLNDPPELPGTGARPPTELPPLSSGHPSPAVVPPAQFPDPADLPPWLQNPSPPGFSVSPVQQPPVFGWDQPDAPAPLVPHPAAPPPGGQSWLPEVGHDLSEGGKKVFGWVVVGGVLIWTILSGGGQGGEASVP
jgi:hypothetical protein